MMNHQVASGRMQAQSSIRGRAVAVHPTRKCAVRPSRTRAVVECRKVAVLGAAGGIGQPLALLLKMSKFITELALYDIANVAGVAADLSHCNTPVKVVGYTGDAQLESALKGADLVIIPAGVPRKPGMTRDDLFNINAGIVKKLVEAAGKASPKAVLQIISNPVNSTVPIAAEVLKQQGVYDPKKLIGVTTLDIVRANTFVAEAKGVDLNVVDVPVIGGHAGITILPLLSQTTPSVTFTDEERKYLTERIQNAGTEVVEAKNGAGSATLSMAYAAARMAESTLLGMQGEANIYEHAFVQCNVVPDVPFFATKIQMGPDGISKVFPLPALNEFEQEGLNKLLPELKGSIQKGVDFAAAKKPEAAAA